MESNAATTECQVTPEIQDGCPLCQSDQLTARHCKLICESCGYVESCEDIFPTEKYLAS